MEFDHGAYIFSYNKNIQIKCFRRKHLKHYTGNTGGGLFDFFNDELTTFKGKYPGFIFNFEK